MTEGFYITGISTLNQAPKQINMNDCYAAVLHGAKITTVDEYVPQVSDRFFRTRTIKTLAPKEPKNIYAMFRHEERIYDMLGLYNNILEHTELAYEKFFVPKASGGLREINAPNDELKNIQRQILSYFINNLHMLPHDAAYAYIKGRSTKECMMQHQANQSQWFLKLDIKDFFPSCTQGFVHAALLHIYPMMYVQRALPRILQACMLNGALPQGAPTSPYVTNLIMIPYDYEITQRLRDYNKTHYVYTRYADDIIISSKYKFDANEITAIVEDVLKETPFRIKHEKTRYGSRAGRNWNLGLMLNKDNSISLGHKFKQRFRATVFSFLTDRQHDIKWQPSDVYQMQGWYSYFRNIEPEYANEVISRYEQKTGQSWTEAIKWSLS